jgi:hypothetical protein
MCRGWTGGSILAPLALLVWPTELGPRIPGRTSRLCLGSMAWVVRRFHQLQSPVRCHLDLTNEYAFAGCADVLPLVTLHGAVYNQCDVPMTHWTFERYVIWLF